MPLIPRGPFPLRPRDQCPRSGKRMRFMLPYLEVIRRHGQIEGEAEGKTAVP